MCINSLIPWRGVYVALLLSGLAFPAWPAERIIYCDSNAASPGEGTLGNPYRALALIPWSTVNGWIATGDSVRILLKRGSVFRETLTMGASGVAGRPIVISDFGEGSPPQISGDNVYAGWSPNLSAPGTLWQTADSFTAYCLWADDIVLFKGTNVSTLRPGEWMTASGTLSYRCDRGNPDLLGVGVRGAVRAYAVVITANNYLTFRNLVIGYARNQAVRILQGQEITFDSCTLVASPECAWVGNASTVFQTCRFINGGLTVDHPAATVRLLYCLLQHDPEYRYTWNLYVRNAASVVGLHSAFLGGNRNQVLNTGSGNLGLTNCIFAAHGSDLDAYGDPTINSSAGTCVVDHCSILPSGRNTAFLTGVTLGRGNLFLGPRFRNYTRDGILMPVIDDYANRYAWDKLCQKANIYGYKTTLAVSETLTLDNQAKALIRSRIAEGHGIAAHTRSHAELGTILAFTLHYVGSGNGCSLSVTGSRLTTAVANDPGGDAIDVDLRTFSADPIGPSDALIKYLDDHPSYECRSGRYPSVNFNHRVPLQFLCSAEIADIKTAAGFVFYDTNAWYRYEIIGSKTDLESAFPEAGNLLGFVYASSGYLTNSELKAIGYPIQFEAGYRYGRTVNRTGNWVRTRMNLYEATIGKSLVPPICNLRFENDFNDSVAARHFIGSNVTYVASGDTTGVKAAWFDGMSSVVTRTNDAAWDYSWRDWMFYAKIRPQSLGREQTLWHHGGNARNSLRAFVTSDGRLAFEVVEQGNVRLTLQSTAGALSTSQTQSVAVQQTHDRWFLWIDNQIAAVTTNLFTIQPQDGPLVLGCSPDVASGTSKDYYGGLMDDVSWVVLGYAQTAAIAETVAFSGGALAAYGHNETELPSELWRLAFQAWKESGVNVCVTNINGGIRRLLETGMLEAGDYAVSSAWRGSNDLRLRPDSPCVDAAEPAVVLGIPGLRDLAGNSITDQVGNLMVPHPDIGPYESAFDRELCPLLSVVHFPQGRIRLRLPAVASLACLFEASSDLQTWFPVVTNTLPTNGFFESYDLIGGRSASFYRARLLP